MRGRNIRDAGPGRVQRQSRAGVGDESDIRKERKRLQDLMKSQQAEFGGQYNNVDVLELTDGKWLVLYLPSCKFHEKHKGGRNEKGNFVPDDKKSQEMSFKEFLGYGLDWESNDDKNWYYNNIFGLYFQGPMAMVNSVTFEKIQVWPETQLKVQPWHIGRIVQFANDGDDVNIWHSGYSKQSQGSAHPYKDAQLSTVSKEIMGTVVKNCPELFEGTDIPF